MHDDYYNMFTYSSVLFICRTSFSNIVPSGSMNSSVFRSYSFSLRTMWKFLLALGENSYSQINKIIEWTNNTQAHIFFKHTCFFKITGHFAKAFTASFILMNTCCWSTATFSNSKRLIRLHVSWLRPGIKENKLILHSRCRHGDKTYPCTLKDLAWSVTKLLWSRVGIWAKLSCWLVPIRYINADNGSVWQ